MRPNSIAACGKAPFKQHLLHDDVEALPLFAHRLDLGGDRTDRGVGQEAEYRAADDQRLPRLQQHIKMKPPSVTTNPIRISMPISLI